MMSSSFTGLDQSPSLVWILWTGCSELGLHAWRVLPWMLHEVHFPHVMQRRSHSSCHLCSCVSGLSSDSCSCYLHFLARHLRGSRVGKCPSCLVTDRLSEVPLVFEAGQSLTGHSASLALPANWQESLQNHPNPHPRFLICLYDRIASLLKTTGPSSFGHFSSLHSTQKLDFLQLYLRFLVLGLSARTLIRAAYKPNPCPVPAYWYFTQSPKCA